MSKKLLVFCTVMALAIPCYAEVQNVKVSGDLLFQGIGRNGFTLTKDSKYKVSGLTSTVRLRVDADLTENVAATIRLLNERNWGAIDSYPYDEVVDYNSEDTNVSLDLAYVTLKEMLYAPLTLTIGRQELRFGNALIIGDPDTNMLAVEETSVPYDLSARKAFDAVRATLNYDPLVLDLVYAKINEGGIWWSPTRRRERDDVDLYGLNARYDLKDLGVTGSAELYYFARYDREPVYAGTVYKKDTCHTVGGLLSGQILENLTGSLEYAYQFGTQQVNPLTGTEINAKRRAWAAQGGLNYVFPVDMSPALGVVYTYLSGDKDQDGGKYKNWDPMFEDQVLNAIPNALFSNSNAQVINVKGSLKPAEDITLSLVYGYYRLNEAIGTAGLDSPYASASAGYTMTGKKDFGNAVDLTATYDYTEDVQFGLNTGWFLPGKAFDKANREDAFQLIGSMKVTF